MEYKILHPNYQSNPISLEDYIFNYGLEIFIKQFYSFSSMSIVCPKNIMMVPYEYVINDPENHFLELLNFLGMTINKDKKDNKFFFEKKAYFAEEKSTNINYNTILRCLGYSSKNRIKNIEKKLGHDIAYDRSYGSHVSDGDDKNWEKHRKKVFNKENIKKIESRLNEFSISLKHFPSCANALDIK